MMDANLISALATVAGVFVAAGGVIFAGLQIREQRRLSRQERAIQLFQFCMSAFGKIASDRVEINANPENQEARAKQNWVDYWDLLAVEFEFARADFLPDQVYARWFEMMRREFETATRVGAIDVRQSWVGFSREYVGLISPAFVEIVDRSLQLSPDQAKSVVMPAITANRGSSIFGALRA